MNNSPNTVELHRQFLLSGGGLSQLSDGLAAAERRKTEEAIATGQLATGAPVTQPRPEGMPEAVEGWRANFERLGDAIAASPLDTRQLKRMAAKALARSLSTAQKQVAKREARQDLKRRKADKRAAKHAAGRDS